MSGLSGRTPLLRLRKSLLLWLLFFLICLGLGYPTLKRYDPRSSDGLSDTSLYYQLVVKEPQNLGRQEMRGRLLTPLVARPFYHFANAYLKNWDAVFFGLLVANSLFCATAASLLRSIGLRVTEDEAIAILASTLYLLNFNISNSQLAGMVDASESCLLLAVTWSLLFDRWAWLPLWGVVGALAKETFIPLACAQTFVWWITAERQLERRRRTALWAIALAVLSLTTLLAVHSIIAGRLVWPWQLAAPLAGQGNYLKGFIGNFLDHNFWYVFGWLLPLGLWRLRRLPKPWVFASACMALTVILLSLYKGIPAGNLARPLFNAVGPLLSLSTALLFVNRATSQSS